MNIGHKLQAAKLDQIEVGGRHRPTHWLRDTPPPAQPPDNHVKCPSKHYNKSLQVHLPREKVVMMQAIWGEALLKVASLEGSRERRRQRGSLARKAKDRSLEYRSSDGFIHSEHFI